MLPFYDRSVTAARKGRCPACSAPIEPGDLLWPDLREQWRCWGCHANASQLERVGGWAVRFRINGHIPPLTIEDASVLAEQFAKLGIGAVRRGARSNWHTTSPRLAWLDAPFDTGTHGLLLDAVGYGFPPRVPGPGVDVIIRICEGAVGEQREASGKGDDQVES